MPDWTSDEIELVAERGYELCQQGKYTEAYTLFEGVLAIDPKNLYCLESLAALCLALGSPERAIDYATLALTFSPSQTNALARRCEACLLLGRFATAQQDLDTLKLLNATTHVKRLTLRMASAQKNGKNPLMHATMRQLER